MCQAGARRQKLSTGPCSRKIDYTVGEIDVETAEVILEKEELPLLKYLILRNLKTEER